jgi:non-specific serine/threonine protein kinase/serine/threonine-protein kinase
MDEPSWQDVKDLFAEATEQPVETRLQFLKERCKGCAKLFDEVNSLLAAADEGDNLIESNAIDLSSKLNEIDDDLTERKFGNYRIIREIGAGGMGTVFLASRDDGEFSMRVALKVVRRSVADREVMARFKRERQILADLNHPHIAVLHDGGVSERSEPFLAMEFVDGDTLIDHANKKNLSIRERLTIFLKVCSAVSYAHKNLVVHRDIKPSNILVTADGEPKLLDFGLAKAFVSDIAVTQTELRAFTPGYASPEQIQGGNITTASDIYSLGVVLYELLTGRKPRNFDDKSFEEILQTINNTEPAKPSSVDTGEEGKTRRLYLRGDLDNIALTALRKEPERRFNSVDGMADDIRKHLEGRPISARPNTISYLGSKFIRRHKLGFAAASFVLISLIAGLAVSIWQADRARTERDRAEKRFQDVRHLSNSLLFEISPKLESLPGSIEARELLVEKALEYLDSLAVESQTDATLQAELASAYEKVGDLQGNINKPNLSDLAGSITSFAKAKAIRISLPYDPDNQLRLANALRVSSMIRNRQHDVNGALNEANESAAIYADLISRDPGSFDLRMSSIEGEIEHGQIYSFNNRYSEAIPLLSDAAKSLEASEPDQRKTRLLMASAYSILSNALSWDGRQKEAEGQMDRALTIVDSLTERYLNDSEVLSRSFQVHMLASSIYEGSRDALAFQHADQAVHAARQAASADKADSQATYNLARALSRKGICQANLGYLVDAAASLRRSERLYEELSLSEPGNVIYQRDLAILYVRMGDTSEKLHDRNDALLKYQNSAVIFEKISSEDQQNTLARRDLAQSLRSIGKTQIAMSQISAAKTNLQRAKVLLDELKAENALGGYDQQLVDDVEKTLGSI